MYDHFDRSFFTHTATARPYWGGDVSVTNLRPAPRRNAGEPHVSLREAVAKFFGALTRH
jgi:hypothetical protein